MYKLTISPRAQSQLKKFKKSDELSVKLALEEIKEDPLLGKALDRDLNGKFSYRFASYRIIYKVNQKDNIVEILWAEHRGRAYN